MFSKLKFKKLFQIPKSNFCKKIDPVILKKNISTNSNKFFDLDTRNISSFKIDFVKLYNEFIKLDTDLLTHTLDKNILKAFSQLKAHQVNEKNIETLILNVVQTHQNNLNFKETNKLSKSTNLEINNSLDILLEDEISNENILDEIGISVELNEEEKLVLSKFNSSQNNDIEEEISQDLNQSLMNFSTETKIAKLIKYNEKTPLINEINFSNITNPVSNEEKFYFHITNSMNTTNLNFNNYEFKRVVFPQKAKAPTLKHNLMTVVQNPGIYSIETMKSIYDKDPRFIEFIPDSDEIDTNAVDSYVPPSQDKMLGKIAETNKFKYVSSTSGIGDILNHLFYKLSNFKQPHFYNLSESYNDEPLRFMLTTRKPNSILLTKHNEGYYSIEKDKFFKHREENVLMKIGKVMERLFTTETNDFARYYLTKFKDQSVTPPNDDFYTFISYNKTLLRSQIDCQGTNSNNKEILFEIKTRAVAPIRYDLTNYQDYLDYEINRLLGKHSSFEREYYDLVRGAFLKYLFQLKIGGMDGAFIAYHNTVKVFGFEYIKLEDMQRRIFGNSNFADIIFKSSLKLFEDLLDRVLSDFGFLSDRLKVGFFANNSKNTLDLFVEIIKEGDYENSDQVKYVDYIDYYYLTKFRPEVYKYSVQVFPIINDIMTAFSPMLFETFDNFTVKYKIFYHGKPSFDEYMKFIHECERSSYLNIENQYTGSWGGVSK